MPRAIRDLNRRFIMGTEPELTLMTASVAIGAAGAVDSTIAGYRVPTDLVVTNAGAGLFTVVFPPSPNAVFTVGIEVSAAGTVIDAGATAKSATAGTASFTTRNAAGAATNPASGDLIWIVIYYLPLGITA